MALVLPERPVAIVRPVDDAPPADRWRRSGVTTVRVLLAVVTLHLVVSVSFSDTTVTGAVVTVVLLSAAGVGATLLHDNGGRVTRVTVCAGAGTLGIAHSVGVSLNSVTRIGLGAGEALFAPALLASVGLLGLAVSRAVSGRGWRVKALAAPAVLALLYYVVAPVTLGTWATHRIAEKASVRTPADVGLTYEDARLAAADGTLLAAWYVPSRNGGAIIVRHGASSSAEAVLDHVAVLARAGYGVLAMDARGHGRSDGESNAFGWYAEDVSVGVDFLESRPGVDDQRIAVLGLSMGGEEAITAAAEDPRISAVVAEGATMRSTSDFLALDKGLAMWVSLPHYFVMYATADLLSDAEPPRPLDAAVQSTAPRPILLIAAGEVPEERRLGEHFVAAAPSTTALWVVDGSDHTGGLDTAPEEWSSRVLTFLGDALGRD